jgi:uncharacterized membrane protein
MTGRLRAAWRRALTGFWLIPGATALGLAGLAVALVALDRWRGDLGLFFAYQGGAGAARDILAVLAGSLITVAGLTFSIMIVTLQLVSAQYTPRALRTFLGDRLTQLVAGTFVGVFAYSLIVLRFVRGGDGADDGDFVPSLSITVAMALGLGALGLLIAFINHMSRSIQVSTIAARIASDTHASLATPYPQGEGEDAGDGAEQVLAEWEALGRPGTIAAARAGFVQAVVLGPLARRAEEHALRVHVAVAPGDFVTSATPLAEVWPATAACDEGLQAAVRSACAIQNERDLDQDALYGLRQLADIAVRALSPGVNDPTTATTCVGYLQDVLERLAAADAPGRLRRFGETVLVVHRAAFRDAVGLLADVASYAGGQPRVARVLVDAFAAVAAAAARAGRADRVDDVVELARRACAPLLEEARREQERRELGERLAALGALRGPVLR